jgi:hypothetical protein
MVHEVAVGNLHSTLKFMSFSGSEGTEFCFLEIPMRNSRFEYKVEEDTLE